MAVVKFSRDEVRSIVLEILSRQSDIHDIGGATTLEELGLDSLDTAEIEMALEEEFDLPVDLPDDALDEALTLDGLVKLMCATLGDRVYAEG